MPQHIGIVGCSAEGAALCYRTICIEGAQLLGAHAHPEVSMHAPSLADYTQCITRDDWQGVGELMLASANKLATIGADFLICPDNTIHRALAYVEPRSPLRWLHIAEAVAEEAVDQVRRDEAREKGPAHKALMYKTRFIWLKNPWNLTENRALRLGELERLNLKINRAYLLKKLFRYFWDYHRAGWAKKYLKKWFW